MKKVAFMFLAVIFSVQLTASAPAEPKDRILNSFHRSFPDAKTQTIYNYGDCYMIYFKDQDCVWRIFYDLEGTMLSTTKYYGGTKLEPYIHAMLDDKYAGKEIFGVTEVSSSEDHFYEVILQDSRSWYIMRSNANGKFSLQKKLTKG